MDEHDRTLSLVLFSGTDDKLSSAAILTAGAAAMGRPVNILLQYWALGAFRSDRIRSPHGVSPEAGPESHALVRMAMEKGDHWSDVLRQCKEIGEVRIHACAKSMEMFAVTKDQLDPLVDDVEGIAAVIGDADGPITFI